MRARIRVCVLGVMTLGACSDARKAAVGPSRGLWAPNARERRFVSSSWDTLYVVRGSSPDAPFVRPRLLAAHSGRLYVYDYGPQRLSAFDSAGHVLWQLDGAGTSPAAFGNVTDVQVAPDHAVWAVDAERRQVVVLDPSGRVVRVVSVGAGRRGERAVQRAVPTPGDSRTFPAVRAAGVGPWVVLNSAGVQIADGQFADEVLRRAPPLSRQPLLAADSGSARWVLAYPMGDRFTVYRDTMLLCTGRYVGAGARAFGGNDSSGRRIVQAAAVAVQDTTVFIVTPGPHESHYRVLDAYSARSCTYQSSTRLPAPALAMAVDRGTFFLAGRASAPTVVAVRRRG